MNLVLRMIKLQAAYRLLAAEEWWDSLSKEQQKEYIKEHPDSRYAQGYHPSSSQPAQPEKPRPVTPTKPTQTKPSTDPGKPKTVNEPTRKPAGPTPKPAAKPTKDKPESLKEGPKAPPPLKEPPELEHPDYQESEKPTPKKPTSRKPKNDEDERSLLKYLLSKGGSAAKKKAKELLKKGGHEALRRLIDPFEMTDIGKKGELPELPFKFKSKEGKIKDLQEKLTKLRKQQKGFGKNVPQNLKDQIKQLSDKLEELQED